MPSLTIRHLTTYRYRRAVAFGEHRMMLHPRDSHHQRVVQADLKINPKPRSLRFIQDAFGNHVGIARFSRRSTELSFESIVRLEHSPREITCTVPGSGREVPCRSSGYVKRRRAERRPSAIAQAVDPSRRARWTLPARAPRATCLAPQI